MVGVYIGVLLRMGYIIATGRHLSMNKFDFNVICMPFFQNCTVLSNYFRLLKF